VGLFAGVSAIALWCCTGPCFAMGSRMLGPMVYTAAISVVGFVAGVLLHVGRQRPLVGLFTMPARVWVAGFVGIAVYTVALLLAVGLASETDVAQVVLVNYLWPLLILGLDLILPGGSGRTLRSTGMIAVAGVLGFAGVAIARGPEALVRSPSALLPHAIALVGALLWALYCVLLRRWRIPDDRNGSTAQWALCAVLALGVGWCRGEWATVGPLSAASVFWVAFCGVGPVGLAYYWWEIGIKRGPAQTIAALSFLIPVGSAALMALLFRQAVSPYLLPGAALIAVASLLAHRATRSV
jgi:drug/metabolite transporter (DMT)-like permease